MAIVAIWVSIYLAQNHENSPVAGGTPVTNSASSSTTSETSTLPALPTSSSSSPCSNDHFVSSVCTGADAWFEIRDTVCQSSPVQSALGNDPVQRPLLLETTSKDGRCLARPSQLARAAGATAADLLGRLTGPAPKLTECALSAGQTLVACSKSHTVEFVGPWQQPASGKLALSDCEDPARRYSGRNVPTDADLTVLVLSATDGRFRCALAVRQVGKELVASVWMLGNNPLPTD
jgi:hypothetical protein